MNLGYVRTMKYIQQEKEKMIQQKKVQEISDLFSDLISMGIKNGQEKRNIKIYTCMESRLFERYTEFQGNLTMKTKYELQEKAYYIAKRYIQIKDQYKGPGIQAGA